MGDIPELLGGVYEGCVKGFPFKNCLNLCSTMTALGEARNAQATS